MGIEKMSYQATVIDVFLSSPSDLNSERDFVVQLASEWNRLRSRSNGCFISILTWEGLVAPALLERPQDSVVEQMGSSYDVYLGMMWTRFGTPTGLADSGTEEEFESALARLKSGDRIRIATLFKNADIDPSSIDALQLHKVQEFKKRVAKEGAFYREFSDDNSLRSIISLLFEQIAKDKSSYGLDLPPIQESELKDIINPANSNEDELGLIEVGEQFTELVDKFNAELQIILEKENSNTDTIRECTEEIDTILRFGAPEPSTLKTIMHKAADSMSGLAARYEDILDDIETDAANMASLIDLDLKIRLELNQTVDDASNNLGGLEELSENITSAIDVLNGLIKTTDSLPRISGEVHKAKKKLSKPRNRLVATFLSLRESIKNSIDYFEDKAT